MSSFHNDRLIHAECKKKIYSIQWILVMLRFKKKMVMQFLLETCLRVNISNNENIENNGILQSFENYE